MNWKKLREFILLISIVLFAAGIYLTVTSGYWVLNAIGFISSNDGMDYLTQWAGNWNYWLLALGLLILVVGGWYTIDTIRKRDKFEEYIESGSKREFVKHIKELEELAYKLGEKYQIRLEEKKRKWRVK